jgi:hypothetical protein
MGPVLTEPHIVLIQMMGPYFGPNTLFTAEKHAMSDSELTITVPEAGKRYFNLCRNASYDAAARGEIPTIRIGRLLRVPVRALERMLETASARPVELPPHQTRQYGAGHE